MRPIPQRPTAHRRSRSCEPVPTTPPQVIPGPDEGRLRARRVVEILHLLADADGAPEGGLLMRVTDPADGSDRLELGVRPLSGDHPLLHLEGRHAPPGCLAVGMHVSGSAAALGGGRRGGRVEVAMAAAVGGDVAARLRWPDGHVDEPDEPCGILVDACLRHLGLPTPPPQAGTGALWTALWVDRIAEAWNEPRRRTELSCWDAVAALHPALHSGNADPDDLVAAARRHAATWTWERLRSSPGLLGLARLLPSPELATWWDEGALERLLMPQMPPVDDLVDDIAPLLGHDIERRLRGAVGELLGP